MTYTLITGASNGIGLELAKVFGANGHNLLIIGRNVPKLKITAEDLREHYGVSCTWLSCDLSDENASEEVTRFISNQKISIQYLVNNAGFYIKGPFMNTSLDQEISLVNLQIISVLKLTKALLPVMSTFKSAGILNVASTGSFVPGPKNAVYCAAKAFLHSFSEALAEELADTPVTVTTLYPGGTRTGLQDENERKTQLLNPMMDPGKVAKMAYSALMKKKRRVIPGLHNKLQVALSRILPRTTMTKLAASAVK